MSDATDIAAHAQRSTDVCLNVHAAVTDPSRKADADERRHCRAGANGALSGLMRELIAIADVAVGTDTIAVFVTEMTDRLVHHDNISVSIADARLFRL